MGMSTPLTARTFPNATVRLLEDAGSKPGGVKAAATPAKATAMTMPENIFHFLYLKFKITNFTPILNLKNGSRDRKWLRSNEDNNESSNCQAKDDDLGAVHQPSQLFRNIMHKQLLPCLLVIMRRRSRLQMRFNAVSLRLGRREGGREGSCGWSYKQITEGCEWWGHLI